MQPTSLLSVLLKVFGIILLYLSINIVISIIQNSPWYYSDSSYMKSERFFLFIALTIKLILMYAGFYLFTFRTQFVAKRLLPAKTDQSLKTDESLNIQQTLLFITGVILLSFAVTNVWSVFIYSANSGLHGYSFKELWFGHLIALGEPIVQCLLGGALTFFPRYISNRLLTSEN